MIKTSRLCLVCIHPALWSFLARIHRAVPIPQAITTTNSVRRLNRNQRRRGLTAPRQCGIFRDRLRRHRHPLDIRGGKQPIRQKAESNRKNNSTQNATSGETCTGPKFHSRRAFY